MAFGQKFDKASAEKSSDDVSTASIWGFPAGSTTIRLLDDLDDWTEYWEHYDQAVKRYFPCTGEQSTCKGCTNNMSSSHRWLANAFIVETDGKAKPGYVNLFKFPKSIMTKVIRHADRKGTLLTHDYEVIRSGSGMDTEYDLERGDESDFDFDKQEAFKLNHEETLQTVYDEYMTASANANNATVVVNNSTSVAKPKASSPITVKGEKSTPSAEQVAAAEAGDPPSEPQAPASTDEGNEEEDMILSEEQIRAMNYEEVTSLAKKAGMEVPEDLSTNVEVADWLISEISD